MVRFYLASQKTPPISAITTITKNETGKPFFNSSRAYIKEGQEVLILNNLTSTQTFTNEKVSRDPEGENCSLSI